CGGRSGELSRAPAAVERLGLRGVARALVGEDSGGPAASQTGGGRMSHFDLSRSQALWNRSHLALESDEILAQILDPADLAAWREIYRLASGPSEEAAKLRRRILRICQTVPLSFPHLFIAAMG